MVTEPFDAPSTKNSTLVTPTLSETEALIFTVPVTVDEANGDVMLAVGRVVSGMGTVPACNVLILTFMLLFKLPAVADTVNNSGPKLVFAEVVTVNVVEHGSMQDAGEKVPVVPSRPPVGL